MPRIVGVDIPAEKRIAVALTYIFGIGKTTSQKIIEKSGLDPNIRAKDLSDDEVNKLRQLVEKDQKTEGDLRQEIMLNIKRLKEVNSYRGSRHVRGLPARGQRTKTNSRTTRGNTRKTMGSGRKPPAQKT